MKAKLCIEANDGVINKAETLLSNTQALQDVKTQSSNASVGQWEQFRPQSNIEPTCLDKEANHLEVSKLWGCFFNTHLSGRSRRYHAEDCHRSLPVMFLYSIRLNFSSNMMRKSE